MALLKSGTQNHKLPKDFALTPEGQAFGRAARRDDLADFACLGGAGDPDRLPPRDRHHRKPAEPEADAAERAKAGWWAALPVLERELDARAVVKVADARIAAARGLIASGAAETADVDRVLARLASQGVRQQGRWTEVLAPAGTDNPQARLTTGLHRDQEAEVIRRVRAAAQDLRFALTPETLRAVTAGQDFTTAIGREQKRAIGKVGVGGAVSVFIGVGGSGKTTRVLPPLVTAYRQQGREVWGIAQAWEQGNRLAEAGIDPLRTFAIKPFLDGLREGVGPAAVDAARRRGDRGRVQPDRHAGVAGPAAGATATRFQAHPDRRRAAVPEHRGRADHRTAGRGTGAARDPRDPHHHAAGDGAGAADRRAVPWRAR